MASSTKRDIVLTLGQFLRERRLDEVTVKDLTERCGISRQAFYYHFSDLYDVVKWGIAWELEQLSKQVPECGTKRDWEYLLELVEDRMLPNRTVVLNVYRSIERSYVQYHLMAATRPILSEEVDKLTESCRVTEEQKQFVTELITMGLVNIFLGWLDCGMPSRHVEQLDDFRTVMDGSVEHILRRLEEKNQQE